ncbi:MAG: ATP-binding protein, partial [Desulfobacteraceae bacterium]|nr:ATP-binding protein [Desulfobacteraceae bacterium]
MFDIPKYPANPGYNKRLRVQGIAFEYIYVRSVRERTSGFMDCLELKIPVALKYLPLAMGFVKQCAEGFGFEEELTLNGIELAAEEAISNAICHACPTEDDSAVTVLCRRIPNGMEILIRDRGIPFDPERAAKFDPSVLQSEWDGSGLGMFLMREIMDEVTYRNLGRDGKEVQLVKYFKHQLREDLFEKGDR